MSSGAANLPETVSAYPSHISMKWTGDRVRYFKERPGISWQPQMAKSTRSYFAKDREFKNRYLCLLSVIRERCWKWRKIVCIGPSLSGGIDAEDLKENRKASRRPRARDWNFTDFIFLFSHSTNTGHHSQGLEWGEAQPKISLIFFFSMIRSVQREILWTMQSFWTFKMKESQNIWGKKFLCRHLAR